MIMIMITITITNMITNMITNTRRSSGRGRLAMKFLLSLAALCGMAWSATGTPVRAESPPAAGTDRAQHVPLRRALDYLAGEMERWPTENGCYSCHNNGDAARVVYRAMARGVFPRRPTASDTWLLEPQRWKLPEDQGPEGDQRLANLQFALAARELLSISTAPGMEESERARLETVVREVTELARSGLRDDSHWPADPTSPLGSPITYGPALATASLRQLLADSRTAETSHTARRTREWLVTLEPRSTLDAAAQILGLTADERRTEAATIARSREFLFDSQQPTGGWGPYAVNRPEVFDTAVAILALCELGDEASRKRAVAGQRFLIERQWEDGSWTETTRPSGRESYAQRISTTAWGTLALLETLPLLQGDDLEAQATPAPSPACPDDPLP
jgi:hypothetical protein